MFQKKTGGCHKYSGALISKQHEFDLRDLEANDKDGNPLIAETSHALLAAPETMIASKSYAGLKSAGRGRST
ncbi:hypothetical protein [Glaciimonas immobilis]|uniref:Deferrochelatase/peroxidase EfeB n=1 Tax=Glaciimonas immobilis TaxID=728004 RepID=A0A840RP26_9BURK|nr:hypothetical protein [Glaciimonas immobilis]KAF3999380.1 hypothetical protein HAV38_05495 [Glaciimonas immobilis]MBB5198872.1 deferrochelatase/peroxidase EfeB [Glaciimonas immobilis]